MDRLRPTLTAHLFPPLHRELVSLLRGLAPEDWQRPTSAGAWLVHDVAAHILEGDLRRLSIGRDGHRLIPDRSIADYADLVGWLNALNADWTRVARRFSPAILIDLMDVTGPKVSAFFAGLAADAPALFAVGWAGEEVSQNWFDIGRDYTERWHHQMQIRDAVGVPGLTSREWLQPILELGIRALPRAYASTASASGTVVAFEITGDAGGVWSLVREASEWALVEGQPGAPAAWIRLDADSAWRLLFNSMPSQTARDRAVIGGESALSAPYFSARALMV
jgi:uncharacterized protein (TIGR03083 family)